MQTRRRRVGFTLIELLIVMTIIIIVSALALPTVLPALSHRQVGEAARIVQGALVGARDSAIHNNAPAGIRLLPDPTFPQIWLPSGRIDPNEPLVFNAVIPIEPAPEYIDGLVSVYPGQAYAAAITGGLPALVVEESVGKWVPNQAIPPVPLYVWQPNNPTSWMWNARLGDKIRFNGAGPWYTVVGPMTVGPAGIVVNGVLADANPELFANVGRSGTVSPLSRTITAPDGQRMDTRPEYLLLANGQDDGQMVVAIAKGATGLDGFADSGWDGIDNDNQNGVDDAGEWEAESWLGSMATLGQVDQPYALRRRPVPVTATRALPLPSDVVIDATTWAGTRERSRLPINPFTGYCDILVNPDGTVVPTTLYGVPTSVGLEGAFLHLWLAERGDVKAPAPATLQAGQSLFLPIGQIDPPLERRAAANGTPYTGPTLKGQFAVVSLFARSGQVSSSEDPLFDEPALPASGAYSPSYPFIRTQQGAR